MSEREQRHPLPALIFLLALTLLTALVWWRVVGRSTQSDASATPTCNPSATPSVVPPPKGIELTVLNATVGYPKPLSGIAKKASNQFKAEGFTVIKTANDTGTGVPGVAVIRFGPSQKAEATLVSFYLPGSQLAQQDQDQPSIVVSLGQKFTKVATGTEVNAALKKAGINVSTLAPSTTPGC